MSGLVETACSGRILSNELMMVMPLVAMCKTRDKPREVTFTTIGVRKFIALL